MSSASPVAHRITDLAGAPLTLTATREGRIVAACADLRLDGARYKVRADVDYDLDMDAFALPYPTLIRCLDALTLPVTADLMATVSEYLHALIDREFSYGRLGALLDTVERRQGARELALLDHALVHLDPWRVDARRALAARRHVLFLNLARLT